MKHLKYWHFWYFPSTPVNAHPWPESADSRSRFGDFSPSRVGVNDPRSALHFTQYSNIKNVNHMKVFVFLPPIPGVKIVEFPLTKWPISWTTLARVPFYKPDWPLTNIMSPSGQGFIIMNHPGKLSKVVKHPEQRPNVINHPEQVSIFMNNPGQRSKVINHTGWWSKVINHTGRWYKVINHTGWWSKI